MSRIGFEYVVLRVVPRVERGEFVNVGVIVYAQSGPAIEVATHLDPARVAALDPGIDVDGLRASLDGVVAVCAGEPSAGAAAALPEGQRFRWLVAPRSTVLQPGPVHTGMTDDLAAETRRLLERLVLPPS